MKPLFAVCIVLLSAPAAGQDPWDPNCPEPGDTNLFAPPCELIPLQWEMTLDDAKSDAEIGFFVRFLRADLVRCKQNISFVNETEERLQRFERAYAESVKKTKQKPVKDQKAPASPKKAPKPKPKKDSNMSLKGGSLA